MNSRHALVNDYVHIFGGFYNPLGISRLDGCQFTKLSIELIFSYSSDHAALTVDEGSKALICFVWRLMKNEWSIAGVLSEAMHHTSALLLDRSIIIFPGEAYGYEFPIQNMTLDSNDTVISTDIISKHGQASDHPIIFLSSIDYCSL
ncbi:Oidioi.mRNA.OKI2018_I69.chr1.g1569.t1.cds [Oikopleura dioica]|uniref:Oidioi.mRNA.OKI2018_I69.chr1.g1569.t1.cds n=1 Tax=Oikopleura dioica TaxID=34765 RepID=A0ABN7SNB5_OIKDI|nr:Oidioi.mRNA.OKI2018_I69.chr1.g1569.t1.cds [Oikopleura dioica]